MSETVHVAGACAVKVDVLGSGLAVLGYTVNGVNIDEREHVENVPGDEHGGDNGPPIDQVLLPPLHLIHLEMSKWDDAVLAQVARRIKATTSTAGVSTWPVLMRGSDAYMRLLLLGPNFVRNYTLARPTGDISINGIGLRSSRARLTFEAHVTTATGVMFNTTT